MKRFLCVLQTFAHRSFRPQFHKMNNGESVTLGSARRIKNLKFYCPFPILLRKLILETNAFSFCFVLRPHSPVDKIVYFRNLRGHSSSHFSQEVFSEKKRIKFSWRAYCIQNIPLQCSKCFYVKYNFDESKYDYHTYIM